jgi:exosortase A
MTALNAPLARLAAPPAAWQTPLLLVGAAWLGLIGLFWRDAASLVDIWWNSSTFNHCLLILPILGWLVWLRSGELAKLTPRGWAPGLLWVAAGALAWLLGEAAGVALVRQLGLVLMLQGCVPALLGPQVTRGLIFPLFYSLFLIPVGEELVPPMQTLTADMAMGLLQLFGIPAHIEGIFITTPAGLFAVAEACSGVKFLVAMAALGVLAAHLCFHSWQRRALFMLVALVVPVLANGFRAFSTMWIAEHWGLEFAAGADHVIYGWVFFGIVIAIVGALSWRWFDRDPDDVPIDGAALAQGYAGRSLSPWWVGAGAALLAIAPSLWLTRVPLTPMAYPSVTERIEVPGWQLADPTADWRPRFDGANQLECLTLRANAAATGQVDLCLARYEWQGEGKELVGYGQGAVDPDSNWRWSEDLAPIGPMRVEHIASNTHRAVASLYQVGDTRTASATRVKLATLQARLLRSDEQAAGLLISARAEDGGRATIARFLAAAGGGDSLLARLTQRR